MCRDWAFLKLLVCIHNSGDGQVIQEWAAMATHQTPFQAAFRLAREVSILAAWRMNQEVWRAFGCVIVLALSQSMPPKGTLSVRDREEVLALQQKHKVGQQRVKMDCNCGSVGGIKEGSRPDAPGAL
ncbi:hypothetical protein NDU88_001414 [Pleurodeles waltl]|uniref:Uncharacterized protein n=1 Tax=Pleurodeles waltl TaxID=8319 RepID=A0AAV7UU45_PLEWA|nr:hypothetical protein NDU88_001414 [Pleurodeles waltl]